MARERSVILVLGAWHVLLHAEPLRPFIEDAGYRFVPISLPSVGISQPRPTWLDDVETIHKTITSEAEAGRSVCLILHSYAGIPGREAVNRFLSASGGGQHSALERIIFLAGHLDNFEKEVMKAHYGKMIRHENGYNYINDPYSSFYNNMSEEEAQPFVDAIQPQTFPLVSADTGDAGDIKHGEPKIPSPNQRPKVSSRQWMAVPSTYFVCTMDNGLLPEYSRTEVQKHDGMGLVEMNWDHCPMVSRPKELAETINRVVQTRESRN